MPFLQTFGAGSVRGFDQGLIFSQQTATFNYTGSVQNWTVPANTQSIYAYVFGAGGASTGDNAQTVGGAGGYTVGNINPIPGSTMKIIVGGAGGNGHQNNGGGGGYSAVATPNWAGSNVSTDHAAIILAAGGGAGAGDHEQSGSTKVFGGAGGGANGQTGGFGGQTRASLGSGGGGSQSAGGVYAGSGGGGNCTAGNSGASCTGATLRGGTGCGAGEGTTGAGWPNQIYGGYWASPAGGNGCNGGGGGGGYYGGAGGGHTATGTTNNSASGGGGSGYTGGSGSYTTTNVGTFAGDENDVPSQATNSGYLSSGVSKGGEYNVTNASSGATHAGGHGKVVLVFIAPV